MLQRSLSAFVLLLSAAHVGCSSSPAAPLPPGAPKTPSATEGPATPEPSLGSAPAETTAPTAALAPATPTASPDRAPPSKAPTVEVAPKKRERIRLQNRCAKPVKLRIERVNDSDTDTTLTNNTSTEERGTDGDEIRLMDDKNGVVHAIKIEPSMAQIEIASSCTKLEGK